jgi:hypothetical protein
MVIILNVFGSYRNFLNVLGCLVRVMNPAIGNPDHDIPLLCHVCGKMYKNQTTLRRHLTTHGAKDYLCVICRKSFSNREYLLSHIRMYLNRLHTNKIHCTCNRTSVWHSSWSTKDLSSQWHQLHSHALGCSVDPGSSMTLAAFMHPEMSPCIQSKQHSLNFQYKWLEILCPCVIEVFILHTK